MRRWLTGLLVAAASLAPGHVVAKDNILASAYAPVVIDLMFAFFAHEVPCLGAIDMSDVCFTVSPATAGGLAESLDVIVNGYQSAGLQTGAWRAANGVWAVELRFGDGTYGYIELYLTETQHAEVNGKIVLRAP